MKTNTTLVLGSILLGALMLLNSSPVQAHCGGCEHKKQAKDIVDTAVDAGNFTTLAASLKAADLVDTLKSNGNFTVFAPTDEAFSKIPDKTLKSLLKPENKAKLRAILTYHVLPKRLMSPDVVSLKRAKTVNGQYLNIKTKGKSVWIDDAKISAVDIKTSNGVIHVIDTVIMPR